MAKKDQRFVVYTESMGFSHAKIILDRKTGVHYLFFFDGSAGGLTPLLGRDGRPIVQDVDDAP